MWTYEGVRKFLKCSINIKNRLSSKECYHTFSLYKAIFIIIRKWWNYFMNESHYDMSPNIRWRSIWKREKKFLNYIYKDVCHKHPWQLLKCEHIIAYKSYSQTSTKRDTGRQKRFLSIKRTWFAAHKKESNAKTYLEEGTEWETERRCMNDIFKTFIIFNSVDMCTTCMRIWDLKGVSLNLFMFHSVTIWKLMQKKNIMSFVNGF